MFTIEPYVSMARSLVAANHYEFIRDSIGGTKADVELIAQATAKFNALKAAFAHEDVVYKRSRLEDTDELVILSGERKAIAEEIASTIRCRAKRLNKAVSKAGHKLDEEILQNYGNVNRQEYEKATANIVNMIGDFRSAKYLPFVTLLGFMGLVDDLEEANNNFSAVYVGRSGEYRLQKESGTMKEARDASDTALEELLKWLQKLDDANEVVDKDPAVRARFVKIAFDFNALVDQTKKILSHHDKGPSSKPNKPGKPTDPSNPGGEGGEGGDGGDGGDELETPDTEDPSPPHPSFE